MNNVPFDFSHERHFRSFFCHFRSFSATSGLFAPLPVEGKWEFLSRYDGSGTQLQLQLTVS